LKVRYPSQAGTFYHASASDLEDQIQGCFLHRLGPGRTPQEGVRRPRSIVAALAPHAGYMYSGPTAAHLYLELAEEEKPETVIILGPNHTGLGSAVSTEAEGAWRTPLGDVQIDSDSAKRVVAASQIIDVDDSAHRYEHSIEVQLPFLQFIYGEFKFVPICMMMQDLETSREIGQAIAEAASGRSCLVIASSDLTHHESQASANRKDRMVIDAALAMDEGKLQAVVERNRISMCGYGPVSTAIVAARLMGAGTARLLSYKTSGDITGDTSYVVGYASMVFSKQ
jgi:AmmeMemoRadiSam system protein B